MAPMTMKSEIPEHPTRRQLLTLLGGASGLGLLALADQLGFLLDLGLGDLFDAGRREGDDRDLVGVVGDEGDALGGRDRGELQRLVDLHRRDVGDDPVGDLGRQRFDGDLAGDVLEHASAAHAGRGFGALELDRDLSLDRLVELDLLQVDVLEAAPHRVQLLLLDHDRDGFAAVDLEVEEGGALGEDRANLAFGDLERGRLGAARVDDARHQPLAAQAARGARAEIGARRDLQG